MELLFAGAGEPALPLLYKRVAGKGRGRPERRRVWVSGELAGYTGCAPNPTLSSRLTADSEKAL